MAEADPLATLDRAQIVIANGVFEPDLSDLGGVEGVTVESLAHVLATSPERVGRLFGDGDDTVMALNSAGTVPAALKAPLIALDNWLLACAMLAIGLHTRIGDLVRAGRKPLALAGVLFVFLMGVGALMCYVMA